jgi:glycosyltransferase involved in cell wall biosynthesis
MEPPVVDILMATYNGETWLDVQLASIFAQDFADWHILVRDDASTDGTRSILRAWRDRFPMKITIMDEDDPKNLGVAGNFSALMAASAAPYVMLASWDDVWYPNKVSQALSAVSALEARRGTHTPLLVHTDLRMVDSNLRELHRSALKYRGMVPSRNPSIGRFCLENTAYGCTIIANRTLIEMAIPIPDAAACEDWWLALVATAFGEIVFRPEQTIDWRRHGANDSGVSSFLSSIKSVVISPAEHRRSFYSKIQPNRRIVRAFRDSFEDRLSPQVRSALDAFLELPDLGFWARRVAILRHRIWYSSRTRMIGLLVMV